MLLRIKKTLTSNLEGAYPLELRIPLHRRGFQKMPLRIKNTLTYKGLFLKAP
jgi:hypothetical protein